MLITLSDAHTKLRKIVDGGTCDTDRLTERTNDVVQWLLAHADPKHTRIRMKILAMNNSIPLPREAEEILAFTIGNQRGHAWSPTYEFLEGGPLDIDSTQATPSDLQDLGGRFPTFYELDTDTPTKLVAFSTAEDDVGQVLKIRGRSTLKMEPMASASPYIELPINRWDQGIEGQMIPGQPTLSDDVYSEVTAVTKPVTEAYVSLWGYDTSDGQMWFLGKYHPDETAPGYQRYKIINHDFTNGSYVIALVRLRYVPVKYLTDVLLIQNMPAIEMMARALEKLESGNPDDGSKYRRMALGLLAERRTMNRNHETEIQVQSKHTWGMGGFEEII